MSLRPAPVSMVDADPVGWHMTAFLLHQDPEQARWVAVGQRILAELDGDTDGVDWWGRALAWLDSQAAMTARVARMPKVVR